MSALRLFRETQSVSQSVSQSAVQQSGGDIREGTGDDVETKDTLGEFQKGRGDTESESKWIGERRVIAPRGMFRMPTWVCSVGYSCTLPRVEKRLFWPMHCPRSAFSLPRSFFGDKGCLINDPFHPFLIEATPIGAIEPQLSRNIHSALTRKRGQHWNGGEKRGLIVITSSLTDGLPASLIPPIPLLNPFALALLLFPCWLGRGEGETHRAGWQFNWLKK